MEIDPIASELAEALTNGSRKLRTVFDQQVTAHGLTYPRARVLFRLTRRRDVTQRELACELELEQATMARLLDRMEETGLIERHPDPRDRRAKLLVLTAHGQEQAKLVRAIADRVREQMFRGLGAEELTVALGVLERVGANLMDLEATDVTA